MRTYKRLRAAFRQTRNDHPFEIDAIVILPEHLHYIWQLPLGDDDFPTRWRLIKARFRWLYRSMNAYPKAACAKASALGSFVNLTKLN